MCFKFLFRFINEKLFKIPYVCYYKLEGVAWPLTNTIEEEEIEVGEVGVRD
jgi:hypothetical protein